MPRNTGRSLDLDCPLSGDTNPEPLGDSGLRALQALSEQRLTSGHLYRAGHSARGYPTSTAHGPKTTTTFGIRSTTRSSSEMAHNADMAKKREESEFYRRLKEAVRARYKRDLSQVELGRKYGVSQGAVSKWALGGLPNLDTVIRIAKDTRYCVEWLLTGRGPKHPGGDLDPEQQELLALYHDDPVFQRLVKHWKILQPDGRMFVLRTAKLEHVTQYTGDEEEREALQRRLVQLTEEERQREQEPADK